MPRACAVYYYGQNTHLGHAHVHECCRTNYIFVIRITLLGKPTRRKMASPEVSPTLKELVEELHDVKTKWKAIGTQLEIDRATLQRIEVTYKNDPEESFTEMMNEWLNTNDDPSWSKIVKALRSRSVNKPMLAKNVELNKCQDLDTVPLTGMPYLAII